jgi:hypothetical protein
MSTEILRSANFVDYIMERRADRLKKIIRGHKTIGFMEGMGVNSGDGFLLKNELADCFTYRTAHGFVNRNPISRRPKRALPGADRFISDLTRPTDSVAMECPDEGVVHFVHGRL